MNANRAERGTTAFPTGAAARVRRLVPALGLLVLVPWVGEFLLGNIPANKIIALPFLMPLYGGGALLIREVTRRAGRGWPTILLLGLAYGIVEASLIDQSLFNPSFQGYDFQVVTPIPALGISASNTIAFVVGHAVWSIGIPIALVELLAPTRRTTPWLGGVGLALTRLLYLFGCAITFRFLYASEQFIASPGQLLGALTAALMLIAVAFRVPPQTAPRGGRKVPNPLALGIGAFIVSGIFFARPENWLGGVVLALVLLVVAAAAVAHWSRQRGWGIRHHFALMAGTFLTYAWGGFVLTLRVRPEKWIAWGGNALFALLALGLLLGVSRALRKSRESDESDDPRPQRSAELRYIGS